MNFNGYGGYGGLFLFFPIKEQKEKNIKEIGNWLQSVRTLRGMEVSL